MAGPVDNEPHPPMAGSADDAPSTPATPDHATPEPAEAIPPAATAEHAPPPRAKRHSGPLQFFRELPILLLIAFGLAILIKTFLVQAFYIPSESMVPTLLVGDRVLVNKLVYRFRDPHRGDIVVFVAEPDTVHRNWFERFFKSLGEGLGARIDPERDFIKRVIGLPGETISIRDSIVTIQQPSGKTLTLNEPYISPNHDNSPFGPFTVPANSYFLMGDNRANSSDSRVNNFGGLCPAPPCAVPKSRIVGRAFITIWPPGRIRLQHTVKYQALADLVRHPWELAALLA